MMHQSYIVRVYRHERNNPRMLVGTVEKVGGKGKAAFTNIDELWEIVDAGAGSGVTSAKAQDATDGGIPSRRSKA